MYVLGCLAILSHVTYIIYGRALKKKHKPLPFDQSIRPLCYGLLSAVIGTQSTLQAKCLSELLIRVDASGALSEWFTYLSFAEFLLTTAFWLYRLNRALALFEPLFIIPVLQVCDHSPVFIYIYILIYIISIYVRNKLLLCLFFLGRSSGHVLRL